MKHDVRAELDELATRLGYEPSEPVKRGRLKFIHASGAIVFTGRYLDDHTRALANARTQLRRVAARAGAAGGRP